MELQKNMNTCDKSCTCDKKRGNSIWGECSRRKMFKTNDDLPDFSLLPDTIVIKIFSYLDIEERCTAAEVCLKWYRISRSACLWKQVVLHRVSSSKVIKFLPELTPAVRHLQLSCNSSQLLFPVSLPDILCKLHQQCPLLKTFILEGATLLRQLFDNCNIRGVMNTMLPALLDTQLLKAANANVSKRAKKCSEQEYSDRPKEPPVLPQLEVLSLWRTKFNPFLFSQINETFLPNIKVLDLTSASYFCVKEVPHSSRIEFLEELYLPESFLDDLDIELLMKSASSLKVLDLERTNIAETDIATIMRHGHCLEKLYLSSTKFTGFSPTLEENENVLPRLHTLCIRLTPISRREVISLLYSFPSLRQVDLTFTEASLKGLPDISKNLKEKLIIDENAKYFPYCDHFYSKFSIASLSLR